MKKHVLTALAAGLCIAANTYGQFPINSGTSDFD
jgi:hypothetical protein